MSLLQAQLAKEEELLRQDEAEVKYLEESLKSNDIARRQQNKTLHPITRGLLAEDSDQDSRTLHNHEMKDSEPSISILFQEQDMLSTLEQLQNHLDTMHNNVHDIKNVKRAVELASLDLKSLSGAPT